MADEFCKQHQNKHVIRLTYGKGRAREHVHLAKTKTYYAEIAQNLFAALRDADTGRLTL